MNKPHTPIIKPIINVGSEGGPKLSVPSAELTLNVPRTDRQVESRNSHRHQVPPRRSKRVRRLPVRYAEYSFS